MKRFFTIAAAATLLTASFATSAFAVGWGPNGQFGKADPNAPAVAPSSTPSTNPASAPIRPVDPTKDLGAVPGSYMDPAVQARLSKAELAARIAKARAAVEGKPGKYHGFAPQQSSTTSPMKNFHVPTGSIDRSRVVYANGAPQMPQMPKPSKINSVPPRPHYR